MMKCRDFISVLIDYIEGQLPADQLAVFEAHMRCCPACQTCLRTYRLTIQLERTCCDCPEPETDERMPEALIQTILEAHRRQSH
jgi:anti-sigma factor RsiW